jgi:hypothetical protein
MKTYSLFDTTTGLFVGRTFSTDLREDTGAHARALAANTPAGHGVLEGVHDHLSRRVELATGTVLDYQPPAPSADHEWNADIKRWQLSAAAQAKAAAAAMVRARHEELIRQQHDDVRRAVLGDVAARERSQAIESEIGALQSAIVAECSHGR